jgi:hypothetical protein
MFELIILEALVFLLFLLPLVRPFGKMLWYVDGVVWLPVLALGIIIGLFPAYGFRPECIPLLLYALIFNIANLPRIASLLRHTQYDGFRERKTVRTAVSAGFLVLVTAAGIYFLPEEKAALAGEGVRSLVVYDERRNNKYFLRVYGQAGGDSGETAASPGAFSPPQGALPEPALLQQAAIAPPEPALRPALLVAPPVTGSILMADRLCASLRDGGFTVVSYSRLDFDFPAFDENGNLRQPPLMNALNLLHAYAGGRFFKAANNAGRFLETERREDIRFLLGLIRQNRGIPGYADPPGGETDWGCVFAAGYGAGGSALLSLTGEDAALRGIVAIESQLLSVYRGNEEPPAPEPPENAGRLRSFWAKIPVRAAVSAAFRKITGIGAAPNPQAPLCFIVSDRVQSVKYQNGRYAALIRVFRTTTAPAILAAVSGAGVLDYSDVPEKYPFYSALFSGLGKNPRSRAGCVPRTAALIINFAASVLEQENGGPSLSRKPLDAESLHLESRGAISLY